MSELNEQTVKEIDDMCSSLEKGKESIEKRFKSILEEFINDSWNNFDDYLQNYSRYEYERMVRRDVDETIEGLLSGDTKWLKMQNIISEHTWEKVQKIRLAIWETAGGEIANSIIFSLKEEVEDLKKKLKWYSESRSY
jgi:hypothetical protein